MSMVHTNALHISLKRAEGVLMPQSTMKSTTFPDHAYKVFFVARSLSMLFAESLVFSVG